MEFLIALWLPIIICGVVLFFASFTAWVILPHHFGDKKQLPDEDAVMNLVREQGIAPGNYMFPYANSKVEQGSEEFRAKYEKGPVGLLDVYPPPNMGMNMIQTVIFFLITSAIIGYITYVACPPGTEFMKVFRIAGTIGILTHASSGVLNGIWFKKRLLTDIVDGIVFGLILGLVFALLWPGAPAS